MQPHGGNLGEARLAGAGRTTQEPLEAAGMMNVAMGTEQSPARLLTPHAEAGWGPEPLRADPATPPAMDLALLDPGRQPWERQWRAMPLPP